MGTTALALAQDECFQFMKLVEYLLNIVDDVLVEIINFERVVNIVSNSP